MKTKVENTYKLLNTHKGFSTIWGIALIVLIFYLIWLGIVLYMKYIEIDEMYSEAYKNRLEIEDRVDEIKRIKREQLFDELGK